LQQWVHAVQVHVDLASPLLVFHLPEVLLAGDERQSGVVHENIHASELFDRPLDHLPYLVGLCDVDVQRQRVAAGRHDLLREGGHAAPSGFLFVRGHRLRRPRGRRDKGVRAVVR